MRTVQEIFDAVIDAGLYHDWANRPMPEAPALADLQESNPEYNHE